MTLWFCPQIGEFLELLADPGESRVEQLAGLADQVVGFAQRASRTRSRLVGSRSSMSAVSRRSSSLRASRVASCPIPGNQCLLGRNREDLACLDVEVRDTLSTWRAISSSIRAWMQAVPETVVLFSGPGSHGGCLGRRIRAIPRGRFGHAGVCGEHEEHRWVSGSSDRSAGSAPIAFQARRVENHQSFEQRMREADRRVPAKVSTRPSAPGLSVLPWSDRKSRARRPGPIDQRVSPTPRDAPYAGFRRSSHRVRC